MHLVKDRSCGECSVCCVVLNVDTKEFQKLPGVSCAHLCTSGGCAIHDTRYEVCRTYHCGWRALGQLGEEWRPDKSGVLIDLQVEGLPSHYPKRPGIRLTLVDKRKALRRPFYDYVARLIASDVPVVLAVTGPPGRFPGRGISQRCAEGRRFRSAIFPRSRPCSRTLSKASNRITSIPWCIATRHAGTSVVKRS